MTSLNNECYIDTVSLFKKSEDDIMSDLYYYTGSSYYKKVFTYWVAMWRTLVRSGKEIPDIKRLELIEGLIIFGNVLSKTRNVCIGIRNKIKENSLSNTYRGDQFSNIYTHFTDCKTELQSVLFEKDPKEKYLKYLHNSNYTIVVPIKPTAEDKINFEIFNSRINLTNL